MAHNTGLNSFAYIPVSLIPYTKVEHIDGGSPIHPVIWQLYVQLQVFEGQSALLNVSGIGPSDGGALRLWKHMVPDSDVSLLI